MANFLRMLMGLALLPMCWGVLRALLDAIVAGAGSQGLASAETLSLLCGIVAFALAWMTLSHPVKTYVLGHELTHALWGLIFGAVPTGLKVGEGGGSVRLTKSNMLITLAPYFFPFYTFVVILAAVITYAFIRPLPYLPLWMFLIGFTWAFHVLFTLQTLSTRQPDVCDYGRIFSWVFIFIVNLLIVIVWLASTTELSFLQAGLFLLDRTLAAYVGLFQFSIWLVSTIRRLCSQT